LAFVAMVYATAILVLDEVVLWSGSSIPVESYAWAPTAGLTFGFLADGLSVPVSILVCVVLAASILYSIPYMERRIKAIYGEDRKDMYGLYYLNYLLLSAGLVGIVLSTNLIELYLFLELVLIPTFAIISFFGYEQKERVAIIYFIWNHLGAFIFLAGILFVYAATGSFSISGMSAAQTSVYADWIVGLILVGWLVKMAVFGVHMWLPITEAEAPTAFAPTMAVVSGIGSYVLVRLLLLGMPSTFQAFSLPLMAWAVLTMFYGGAVTLVQSDLKYMFAWSTVSQNAYSILGIASFSVLGASGAVFYFLSHIMGKLIMFSVAGILLLQTGSRDLKSMKGLASKMPLTAAIFILGALILSAVPPTGGFMAEWIMFAGIFTQGATGSAAYFWVAILGLAATMLTVAYTLWPIRRIFFGQLPETLQDVKEAPLSMTLPLLAVIVISIIIGIYPNVVSKFLISIVNYPPLRGSIPG